MALAATPPGDGGHARRILAIGPGTRSDDLAAVLGALARDGSVSVVALGDVEDLVGLEVASGVLLLDADALPLEDLGYVRRFLARRPGFALAAIAADPRSKTTRALAQMGAVRILERAPDLDQLIDLVTRARGGPAGGSSRGEPVRPAPRGPIAPTTGARDDDDDELEAVRAILAGETDEEDEDEDFDALENEDAAEVEEPVVSAPAPSTAAPAAETGAQPRWLRPQVADLADVAQRVDLSLRALLDASTELAQSDSEEVVERLAALESDVARLVQFARTLGYLVAPPVPGDQLFDLGEMLNVFAQAVPGSGPDAPRCLFKAAGAVPVRSDKGLLGAAFDALFFVARSCGHRGDVVRAHVRRVESLSGARAEARIEFPAGPLDGMSEAEVLEPYALRDVLPDLGPNALAAAASIFAGQDGSLRLGRVNTNRLEWRVDLPMATVGGR